MAKISKDELHHMYIELNMTDKEIAIDKGLSKSYITQLRKKYKIKAIRGGFGFHIMDINKKYLIKEFENHDIEFKVNHETNPSYLFNINNKRIKVASSYNFNKDKFAFSLVYTKYDGYANSAYKIEFNKDKYKIIYSKICDYVILIGHVYEPIEYWVFTSEELDKLNTGKAIMLGKYDVKYRKQYMNLNRIID